MKNIITGIFIFIALTNYAKSQDSGFGIGVMFGEPTGISMKGWISPSSAIDGGVAWSFVKEGAMNIHADYLYHFRDVFQTSDLALYLGAGGRIKFNQARHSSKNRLGVRVPVGIVYMVREANMDVFLEIAPILDLAPETDGSVNGSIGIRYYFK